MMYSNPAEFAEWFNSKVPHAYRKINADDVCLMTECGLIGKFKYFLRQDLETVRCILQYELQRDHQDIQPGKEKDSPTCRRCKQPLVPESEGKVGRPKEYCPDCESVRSRLRQETYRHRHRKQSPWKLSMMKEQACRKVNAVPNHQSS